MILVFITSFCALIALGFGAAAAWSDVSRLIIPNMYILYILTAFFPAFLFSYFTVPEASLFYSLKGHILGGLLVFAISYALFHFKLIGGGDSKLLSVYALWVGLGGLLPLLFFMALTGGLLGLTTLYLKKYKPVANPKAGSWVATAQSGTEEVPYGVAILVGAGLSFWQNGYIRPQSLLELAQMSGG